MSLHAMAGVTGAILAVYLGCLAYAILAPAKQPDPQRGMASAASCSPRSPACSLRSSSRSG